MENAATSPERLRSLTVSLIFHGALLGNAMTWWDHSTGSIWTQPTGEAIAGPRKGQTVELLPSQFTSWDGWKEAHPKTQALDVAAGPSSFDLADFLIVVDFTDEARGYPIPELREVGVVNDVVADSAPRYQEPCSPSPSSRCGSPRC